MMLKLSARRALCATVFLLGCHLPAQSAAQSLPVTVLPNRAGYAEMASEVNDNLKKQVLDEWFPRSIDERLGGFDENYSEDWSPGSTNDRSVVYQARLTWVAAMAARRFPRERAKYLLANHHGVEFLRSVMWDSTYGGFYFAVAPGSPLDKHAYGISFGMYAAAASYATTHDPAALDLAKRAFLWLEDHAHDTVNGGYYESFDRAGLPVIGPGDAALPVPFVRREGNDQIGTPYGQKSMNTHIHLLESLTELHSVWKDPTVTNRLQEVYEILRDKIIDKARYQQMFFKPDWQVVSQEDSYGHDIETAYLLSEAATELGSPNDPIASVLSKSIVDHTLDVAEDKANGGICDHGSPSAPGSDFSAQRKVWWVQAEALNSMLMMHERYGKKTRRYWDAFVREWNFIQRYQVDHIHGGWYRDVAKDGSPLPGASKSDGWTEAYHQARALMNVEDRLVALEKTAH